MHNFLIHFHSGFRYIVLLFLIMAIVKAFSGWTNRKNYRPTNRKLNLFAMIFIHVQLALGLALYFMSDPVQAAFADMGAAMKNPVLRFWAVEHILGMVVATALVTIGRKRAEKAKRDQLKFKRIAIFYLIALIIILVSIPWPFLRESIARGWF